MRQGGRVGSLDLAARRMPTGAMKRLFVEEYSSSSAGGGREAEPAAAVLCAPRPRRAYPCSADLILGPPILPASNNKKQKERKNKRCEEEDEELDGEEGGGGWALFGGSPPARAANPLVHDPHFLLNQRHPAAASPDSPPGDLAIFDDHGRNYGHFRPTYSSSSSFAPSYAPAVRIQGFDVSACRSSHGGAGGRVLSARA